MISMIFEPNMKGSPVCPIFASHQKTQNAGFRNRKLYITNINYYGVPKKIPDESQILSLRKKGGFKNETY